MGFALSLTPDLLTVEAGATTPLALTVANRGEKAEQIEIQIEGIDPEWLAVPEPVFHVEPGEDHVERVFFKPARVSESLAGNYPFVLRARSLDSGEAKTAAGVLQIKPYNHLSMEIGPRKGYYSRYRKANTFQVTVMNLGNTEHTLQLFGNDPEDECAFDFGQETFVLAPGQSRIVEVSVTPKTEKTFSGSRLYGFSISARSTNAPNVVASTQAQLEQRPMLSAGTLVAGIFALVIFLAWFALLPKPPNVELTVSPSGAITQGDKVHIAWDSNSHVQIKINGSVWQDNALTNPAGMDYLTTASGPLTIEAIPYRDQKPDVSHAKHAMLMVNAPPVVPEPEIAVFTTNDRSLALGDSVILKYKLVNVEKAVLGPAQTVLDINTDEIQVTPTRLGPNDYTIVAYNKAGKSVSKKITVNVHEKIDVTIDSFTVTPTGPITPGESVSVTWRVSKAVKVTLTINGVAMDVQPQDSRTIPIQAATVIILSATDDKNHTVTKRKVVTIPEAAPSPDPTATPPPTEPPL